MGNYLGVLQDSSLVAVGEKKDGGQWRGAEGHSLDTPTPNVSPVCPFISAEANAAKPAWNFLDPPQVAVGAAGYKQGPGTLPSVFRGPSQRAVPSAFDALPGAPAGPSSSLRF